MLTFLKGLKHIGLDLSLRESLLYSVAVALAITIVGTFVLNRISRGSSSEQHDLVYVEKVFSVLMLFTACSMAFAHGSNDVANAIGPLAAVNSIIESGGFVAQNSTMPIWILFLGGAGIVVGLATYGHKVIRTIGTDITPLTPSSAFAVVLAAVTTVAVSSGYSLPVSTTHTLVGGVLGVGFARGISAVNLRVVATIIMSWMITLPAGAILSIIFFFLFKAIFGTG